MELWFCVMVGKSTKGASTGKLSEKEKTGGMRVLDVNNFPVLLFSDECLTHAGTPYIP